MDLSPQRRSIAGLACSLLAPVLVRANWPAARLPLGLLGLGMNGIMVLVTASLVPARFQVDGLGWAIIGGILMSIISLVLESALGVRDKK